MGNKKLTIEEIKEFKRAVQEGGARAAHYLCEKCIHYVVVLAASMSTPGAEKQEGTCKCGLPVEPCTNPNCNICEYLATL